LGKKRKKANKGGISETLDKTVLKKEDRSLIFKEEGNLFLK